ncbi:resistance to inhibitors of cholinesterase protein 3 isoform X1 [Patella vulgata]|uniref:resistance to inhibitors of cholinesterase protein 3 isoform X1 n=1 Tax=Patella vulgata TaxID=6465 RepID=UPI00217FA9EE|nr:resistance to inhibitors of cholinesterase protein 3 isoform X1 [Patella vulgata]
MSTIKTVGVLAIIVGCFAILYPRFMHPIVLRAFGMHKTHESGEETPLYPPHKMGGDPRARANARPEGRQHMRPGPPPGLRASVDMERERAQQGGGRGMMGVVLPMYAVGIVLYLIYTLVKVFNKRSEEESGSENALADYLQKETPTFDATNPHDCNASMEEFMKRQKNNELEKLLVKADDKNITSVEMKALQKRLEETEAQMSSILRAMQAVSTKVDDVAASDPDLQDAMKESAQEAAKCTAEKTDKTLDGNNVETSDEKSDKSSQESPSPDVNNDGERGAIFSDSSPDLASFEIVDRKKGSHSDTSNNTEDDISQSLCSEVENIGAGDLPESESKMRESESTESCSSEKDNNMVAPESEQGEVTDTSNEQAEGTTEEILPEAKTEEVNSSLRHRKTETSP